MRLRCGRWNYESREYAGQDGLIVRLVKVEACVGREGELTFEGIDDDGWYWINGDYNAALAPLVRESSLRPELRPPIPDGVTASPSGDRRFMLSVTGRLHGTLVEHEANGFIGIIPHIADLEGAGRHAAPFWRGHGGVAGRPMDGVSATFLLTCADGRSYAYELEPRPDGFIAYLLGWLLRHRRRAERPTRRIEVLVLPCVQEERRGRRVPPAAAGPQNRARPPRFHSPFRPCCSGEGIGSEAAEAGLNRTSRDQQSRTLVRL